MNKKIILFRFGLFSNTSFSVFEQLKINFKEYEVVIIDVAELILKKKSYVIVNFFYFIFEYGIDFLLLRKSRWAIKDWFLVTSYIFKKSKIEVQKFANDLDVVFTIQTGSLFDGSLKGVPHFVYTDSTVLANMYYPNIKVKSILKSKSWMKLEPSIYKNATLNFTFSTNQIKSLIEQYGINENKIKCIYAGSNTPNTFEQDSEKNYNNKIIIFVGVNWMRKGGDILAKAFNIVLKSVPDAKLLIVGVSEDIVRHHSPELMFSNCIIKGRIPLSEVEQYYSESTVFCLPTRIEPFGIAFIEAMRRKLPVVASDIGAIPDFIIQNINGYRIHPDDVDGFAKALIELLNNPEKCKKMGEEGYKIVLENYTWENTGKLIKKYVSQYI